MKGDIPDPSEESKQARESQGGKEANTLKALSGYIGNLTVKHMSKRTLC